jgi:hypothetical protein
MKGVFASKLNWIRSAFTRKCGTQNSNANQTNEMTWEYKEISAQKLCADAVSDETQGAGGLYIAVSIRMPPRLAMLLVTAVRYTL